jgi:hypothetical protein
VFDFLKVSTVEHPADFVDKQLHSIEVLEVRGTVDPSVKTLMQ